MITEMMHHQALVFWLAIQTSIVLTFIYDVLNIMTNILMQKLPFKVVVYCAYGLEYLYVFARFIWIHDLGELRMYTCIGFMLGMWVYISLISPRVSPVLRRIIIFLQEFVKKILIIICKPLKNLYKQIRLCMEAYLIKHKRRGVDRECPNREEDAIQ